ncbi:LysE family translocator [Gemmobacter fulvus]|uniref:LysE family translocator n=1 Tax=Gemmobacter fulvus TaxID=2840474 RepID=A0A975P5B1_9RHOB|nr:LysE family translocator [Gemmobacter fulvus]MBT9247536.1 LysE family translocator [Gemmobacter fulvus]QWK89955.1 LysE family translocator [Gemmobacter fulvus]
MQPDPFHPLMLVYLTYLVAVASPGPSTMAIMGVAMRQGRAAAVALALGVMTGSLIWAGLAAVGISALLARFAGALYAIKIAGGLYLLYFAWKSAKSALTAEARQIQTGPAMTRGALYVRGVLLHLSNPKSILGWIAILSLGLRPDAAGYTLAAILGGCAVLGVVVFVGYALVFSTAVMGRAYLRTRRWVEGTLALLFGYAGIRLLLTRV